MQARLLCVRLRLRISRCATEISRCATEMSNWDGGIRVNAFAAGGFLPAKVRGSKYVGLVAGWDWYSTFSLLAGIDPTDWRAAAANLPPVDSHSMVPVLMGTGNSTRIELTLGTEPRLVRLLEHQDQVSTLQGVIQEDLRRGKLWKLLLGYVEQSGWTGPHYPNRTTNTCCFNSILQNGAGRVPERGCPATDPCVNAGTDAAGVTNCTLGCLFELRTDPVERVDLALEYPGIVEQLMHRVEELRQTAFLPVRCLCDDGWGGIDCQQCPAAKGMCAAVTDKYGGFYGPWVDV